MALDNRGGAGTSDRGVCRVLAHLVDQLGVTGRHRCDEIGARADAGLLALGLAL